MSGDKSPDIISIGVYFIHRAVRFARSKIGVLKPYFMRKHKDCCFESFCLSFRPSLFLYFSAFFAVRAFLQPHIYYTLTISVVKDFRCPSVGVFSLPLFKSVVRQCSRNRPSELNKNCNSYSFTFLRCAGTDANTALE